MKAAIVFIEETCALVNPMSVGLAKINPGALAGATEAFGYWKVGHFHPLITTKTITDASGVSCHV